MNPIVTLFSISFSYTAVILEYTVYRAFQGCFTRSKQIKHESRDQPETRGLAGYQLSSELVQTCQSLASVRRHFQKVGEGGAAPLKSAGHPSHKYKEEKMTNNPQRELQIRSQLGGRLPGGAGFPVLAVPRDVEGDVGTPAAVQTHQPLQRGRVDDGEAGGAPEGAGLPVGG